MHNPAEIVFVCPPYMLGLYQHVIRHFATDSIDILVPQTKTVTSMTDVKDLYASAETNIVTTGEYTISMLEYDKLAQYQYVIADLLYYRKGVHPQLSAALLKKEGSLSLSHSPDRCSIPAGEKFRIEACKNIIYRPMDNRITKDLGGDAFTQAMHSTPPKYTEFSYSGPFHLGEWETKRNSPKELLRNELENYLQRTLPNDKPVVAFFQDFDCYMPHVAQYINNLAKYTTVIAKLFADANFSDDVIVWPNNTFSPNLLRFASDIILAGFTAGTLASSMMLGLNVIPFHTQTLFAHGFGSAETAPYAPIDAHSQPHTCPYCVAEIGFSMDLENTNALMDLINNDVYWTEYHRRLPAMQQTIFGDYIIEGAAHKTAELIKQAFKYGTFGTQTEAVLMAPNSV